MTEPQVTTSLVDSNVFRETGECIGSIDELLIDPFTGIVRSILLKTESSETIQLPWSAMIFDKSKKAFRLTPAGESAYRKRCN